MTLFNSLFKKMVTKNQDKVKEKKKEKEKEKEREPGAKRHHMVSGTLAQLYTVFGLKLGCSGVSRAVFVPDALQVASCLVRLSMLRLYCYSSGTNESLVVRRKDIFDDEFIVRTSETVFHRSILKSSHFLNVRSQSNEQNY